MNRSQVTPLRAKQRLSTLLRSKAFHWDTDFVVVALTLLAIWIATVIFTSTRHEFFRDEIRALSLARAAISPIDLFRVIHAEGHPVLWYFLLYIGKSIVDTPLVLPIISLAIAIAAVTVFVFCAPFPLWFKGLFIFCALPVYEYSVMARNYGISMLLLFVGAAVYKKRHHHPLLLAFTLALLANTNVHSALFASLIAVIWAWEAFTNRNTASARAVGRSLYLPLAIVLAGVLLCTAVTFPGRNNILVDTSVANLNDIALALGSTIVSPQRAFATLVPAVIPPLAGAILLYMAICGLLPRIHLMFAALGSLLILGVFFRVVYIGLYRHQGLFLLFLLFLYWIAIESYDNNRTMSRRMRCVFNTGLYGAVLVLIAGNVLKSNVVIIDIQREISSSKAFGAFLNNSTECHSAIIVPEPDYLIESVPYYADNAIYLPREHRFGVTVSWTTEADGGLSMDQLLDTARKLKARYNRPVLIVLGHRNLALNNAGHISYSYNKTFSWSVEDLAAMNQSTILAAAFTSAIGDENYEVYALR